MDKLKLAVACPSVEEGDQQQADTELFFELMLRCASNRAWTMASWSETPPNNWAGILSKDLTDAQQAMDRVFDDARCVQKALDKVAADHGHHDTQVGVWV